MENEIGTVVLKILSVWDDGDPQTFLDELDRLGFYIAPKQKHLVLEAETYNANDR